MTNLHFVSLPKFLFGANVDVWKLNDNFDRNFRTHFMQTDKIFTWQPTYLCTAMVPKLNVQDFVTDFGWESITITLDSHGFDSPISEVTISGNKEINNFIFVLYKWKLIFVFSVSNFQSQWFPLKVHPHLVAVVTFLVSVHEWVRSCFSVLLSLFGTQYWLASHNSSW